MDCTYIYAKIYNVIHNLDSSLHLNVVYILTGMTVLSIGGPGILYFPVAYPGVSLQTGKVRVESPYVAPKLNLRSKKKSIVTYSYPLI